MLQVYICICQSHLYTIYMYLRQLVLIREDSTVVLLQAGTLEEESVPTLKKHIAKKRYSKEASQCLYAHIWHDTCVY